MTIEGSLEEAMKKEILTKEQYEKEEFQEILDRVCREQEEVTLSFDNPTGKVTLTGVNLSGKELRGRTILLQSGRETGMDIRLVQNSFNADLMLKKFHWTEFSDCKNATNFMPKLDLEDCDSIFVHGSKDNHLKFHHLKIQAGSLFQQGTSIYTRGIVQLKLRDELRLTDEATITTDDHVYLDTYQVSLQNFSRIKGTNLYLQFRKHISTFTEESHFHGCYVEWRTPTDPEDVRVLDPVETSGNYPAGEYTRYTYMKKK